MRKHVHFAHSWPVHCDACQLVLRPKLIAMQQQDKSTTSCVAYAASGKTGETLDPMIYRQGEVRKNSVKRDQSTGTLCTLSWRSASSLFLSQSSVRQAWMIIVLRLPLQVRSNRCSMGVTGVYLGKKLSPARRNLPISQKCQGLRKTPKCIIRRSDLVVDSLRQLKFDEFSWW